MLESNQTAQCAAAGGLWLRGWVVVGVLLAAVAGLPAGDAAAELAALRQAAAEHYFDPDARVAFAAKLKAQGQEQTAFYLAEDTRKSMPSKERIKQFFNAFEKYFNGKDISAAAEKKLRADFAQKKTAATALQIAHIEISHGDMEAARKTLEEAMRLAPGDPQCLVQIVSVLARQEKKEEGQKLMADFAKANPESAIAARMQLMDIMQAGDVDKLEPTLEADIKKFPKEGWFYFVKAQIGLALKDQDMADAAFNQLGENGQDNADYSGAVGQYFFKGHIDPEKAAKYYLQAYFINFDYKDSEYAEAHLRRIFWDRGQVRFLKERKANTSVAKLLADSDPVTITAAISEVKEHWDAACVDPLFALWSSDDPNLRAQSADCLGAHVDDKIRDRAIAALKDKDPYRQGMAMYVVMRALKEKGVSQIKPFLSSPIEMLRYDAVSSLLEAGGAEGRKVVADYLPGEKDTEYRDSIQTYMAEKQ